MRKIMVATDDSDGANRAVTAAAELAKAVGGRLLILTVSGNITGDEIKRLARAERDVGDTLESLAEQVLRKAVDRAQRSGISAPKVKIGWGDAAEVIIETAQREQIDMIVVGRRGHGRLSGLLLGSVSQKLASLAPCIVTIVP